LKNGRETSAHESRHRDGGYIKPRGDGKFLDFGPETDGKNLSEIAEPTLTGKIVLELRRTP
jgi:hypothetical protein